jgi:hypothetical protein
MMRIDKDGENKVIRTFLQITRGAGSLHKDVRAYMNSIGIGQPRELAKVPDLEQVTTADMQVWLRHLFALEASAKVKKAERTLDSALVRANMLALLKGSAQNNDALLEAKAEASCTMGVGCGTSGVCYAAAMGRPDECGRVE